MNKDRFSFVCNEAEGGRDAFVVHPERGEEGRVLSCSPEHVVVELGNGEKRCWDYDEVTEMTREREEFPFR